MPNVDESEGLTTVPSAAMGLSEVVRWTREHPFIDVFKTTVPWVGTGTDGSWRAMSAEEMEAGGFLDSDGWPTEIPSSLGTIATTMLSDLPPENTSMAGRYHLTYEGEGTVEIRGASHLINVISEEDGEIIFEFTPGEGMLIFEIHETDPNGTGNYIRDVSVVKEEYVELHEAGAIFNPVWIDLIEDLGAVRFMDWMRTNNSEQSEWADRPQVGDPTWGTGSGVPLEVMVELANQIGSDPWFNIPFHATEEYVREFAAYVRDNLDPDLKARFEFSNEVWNNTFDQTDDAHAIGRELWGDEYGGYPGRNYYGYRSAEVMEQIRDVFGDEADARIEGVLGVHTATPSRFERIMTGAERYASENGLDVNELFDSVAVTWYFGGGFKNQGSYNQIMEWAEVSVEHAVDKMFEQLETGALIDDPSSTVKYITDLFPQWAEVAQQHGLNLISYEGGAHIRASPANRHDTEFVEILTAASRDPRMLEIYNEIHEAWVEAGGGLFNAFQDIKRDGESGSFGHLTHLDDEHVRWDAVMAINETPNENMAERDVSDFDHGRTLLGGDDDELLVGTLEEDYLIGAGGNDELHGGNKNDGLHGGSGNDKLYAGSGDDNVIGGDGDDWLDGGSGVDTVLGGAGNDTIVFDAEDDFANVDGGAGTDILRINGGDLPTLDLAAHGLEGADHVLTGEGDAGWSELVDHYDVNWVRTSQDGTFTDGRTWHTEYDVADAFDWSEYTEIFDAAGNFLERIEVSDDADANRSPVDITVSGGSIDEGASAGTVVATLSAVDPDAGDSFSYAITNDPSGLFEIVGNQVRVANGAEIDFEAAPSHQITVEVTDAGGLSYSEVVTVSVEDHSDETPTDIVVEGGSMDENAPGGTVVATLSAVDADAADSFTFVITDDPTGMCEMVGNEIRLIDGAEVDFEKGSSVDIVVEVTDAGGNSYSEVVTLTVNDLVDEAPTDILVDGGSVDENAEAGTVVAMLSSVDADAGDSFSYEIANDPSGLFEIVGTEIRVASGAVIDFEAASSHEITVEVTDSGFNTYAEVITLTVNDLDDGPSVVSIEGTDGDDELFGTAADEVLLGGAGHDWLDGGEGFDSLKGGDGNDKLVYDADDNLAGLDGGDGFDTLVITDGLIPDLDLSAHNLEAAEVVLTDAADDKRWSQITDRYDAEWNHVSQQGIYDNGNTWSVVWDANDLEDWSREVTLQDLADNSKWEVRTERFNDDGQLTQRIEVRDNGKIVTRSWDRDGTEEWSREIEFYDALDQYVWTSRTSRFDDQGRKFEQYNVRDDGRIIEKAWDHDGAESWFKQVHIADAENAYDWSEQTYEFDENGNLLNHVVVDDLIV